MLIILLPFLINALIVIVSDEPMLFIKLSSFDLCWILVFTSKLVNKILCILSTIQ